MATRKAACSCGQLRLIADGDPIRVSICHCHECQRRTGSVFGVQARFDAEQLRTEGRSLVPLAERKHVSIHEAVADVRSLLR
jgi:hypothetical protein